MFRLVINRELLKDDDADSRSLTLDRKTVHALLVRYNWHRGSHSIAYRNNKYPDRWIVFDITESPFGTVIRIYLYKNGMTERRADIYELIELENFLDSIK